MQRSDEARKEKKSRDTKGYSRADMEKEREEDKGRSKVKESEDSADPPQAKKSKRDHSPMRR